MRHEPVLDLYICPVTDDVEDLDMLLGPGSNIYGRPS